MNELPIMPIRAKYADELTEGSADKKAIANVKADVIALEQAINNIEANGAKVFVTNASFDNLDTDELNRILEDNYSLMYSISEEETAVFEFVNNLYIQYFRVYNGILYEYVATRETTDGPWGNVTETEFELGGEPGTKLYSHKVVITDSADKAIYYYSDIGATVQTKTLGGVSFELITDNENLGDSNIISSNIIFVFGTGPTIVISAPCFAKYTYALHIDAFHIEPNNNSSGPTTVNAGIYRFIGYFSASHYTDTVTPL